MSTTLHPICTALVTHEPPVIAYVTLVCVGVAWFIFAWYAAGRKP